MKGRMKDHPGLRGMKTGGQRGVKEESDLRDDKNHIISSYHSNHPGATTVATVKIGKTPTARGSKRPPR